MSQQTVHGTSQISICSVRAALQKMIKDSQLSAQNEACMSDSVTPAAPVGGNSISSARGYSNWRARSIIREIAALNSPTSLADYEVELRGMITFQELRRRTTILREFIHEECFLREKAQLERAEERARLKLDGEWAAGITLPLHFMQFLLDEEVSRSNLIQEERYLRWSFRQFVEISVLSFKESEDARFIHDVEVLEREELQKRRLMEVGQEIRYEILRRSLSDALHDLNRGALVFIREYKRLFRAEEQDRLAIEKIGFFSFGILMRDANTDWARALREDVALILYEAQRNEEDSAVLIAVRDQQNIIHHETQIRQMVIEAEEKEWQQVYNPFILGWRDVYQRISAHSDVVTLVSSLELFERRCIYDQYRHSLHGLSSLYDYEHRVALMYEKRYWQFFDDLISGMTRIWVDEGEEFAEIRKQYIAYEVKTKAIHSTRMLILEEAVTRKEVENEELQQRMQKKIRVLKDKCHAEAMSLVWMIESHEASEWDLLMYEFHQQCFVLPQRDITREEFVKRLDIEGEEERSHIQLVYQQEVCRYRGVVSAITTHLLQDERKYRYQIMEHERRARVEIVHYSCMDMERQSRRALIREEKHGRVGLSMRATEGEDLFARELLFHRSVSALVATKLELVQRCEATSRVSIVKSEKNRREFLISSIPYEHLFLRACEVDELADRLEIITHAELCIRACAFSYGHNAPVAYCDPTLRMLQAQLHFQSLAELFEDQERQLVHEIEPIYRKKLERGWLFGVIAIKIELEESSCRLKLCSSEASDWDSIEKISSRIIGRQRSWEQRALIQPEVSSSLSARDELLQYLERRQDPSYVAELAKRKQNAIRSSVAAFMENLYWSRDRLLREEEAARYGLLYAETKAIRRSCSGSSSVPASSQHGGDAIEKEKKSIESFLKSPKPIFLMSPTLFIHSVVVHQPMEEARRAVTVALFYTGEGQSYRIPLSSTHHIRVSGKNMEILVPSTLHSWLPENAPYFGVVYLSLLDVNGQVVATASHLLQEEDKDTPFLSVEFDNTQGRVYLAKCMKFPEESKN